MIATQPTKVHFRTHEPEALADFSHIEPEALADFSHIDPAALADSCTSHEFGYRLRITFVDRVKST